MIVAMARCAAIFLLGALVTRPTAAAGASSSVLAEADALYARRAEGSTGSGANTEHIDHAIALYRRALQESPASAEALAGLLRALHFKGAFCGAALEDRRAAFEEAKNLGQAAIDAWEKSLSGQPADVRLRTLRERPSAVGVYFWTGAAWGQWALVRGKFASARQGVAGRIRDLAETVIAIDPRFEEGGGYRLLGRLHDQAPKILFVTGWVSRPLALQHLRASHAISPQNTATRFFLAEAILDHEAKNAAEAKSLLRSCAEDPPRDEYLVEDRYYAEEARALLKRQR